MDAVEISEDFLEPGQKLGDHVYMVSFPEMKESLYLLERYDEETGIYTAIECIIH